MDDSDFDGINSLVKLTGVSVPARARFVGEALLTSTMTSLTLGLSFGIFGSTCLPIGPLVPFLFGSWTGYTLGLVHHWNICKKTLMTYATNYPTLLAHALLVDRGIVVPRQVIQASEARISADKPEDVVGGRVTLDTWLRQGGLGRITWAILAAQSCSQDVKDLERRQREKLMDEYQEKHG